MTREREQSRSFERVVEGRSKVEAAKRLFAHIADYVSQWHKKTIKGETFERVVEGRSIVEAVVRLFAHIADYVSQ